MAKLKVPTICAIIGGQYGSEGKGVVAYELAHNFNVHVRVGGPNAGHSFASVGKLWKMRAVPCGWVNPRAKLVIGRGAVIDVEVLQDEIAATGSESRTFVDSRAIVVLAEHKRSKEARREAFGSTGEGVGPCRTDWVDRKQVVWAESVVDDVHDTVQLLNDWLYSGDEQILLEGTQGTHLSLIHGRWPYVTSHDTTAAQLLADVGLAPAESVRTVMVLRTFPIRVAGNSGPLPHETTWEKVSRRAGRFVEEFTTVTNRLRRVAEFDLPDAQRAVMLNRPSGIVLNFLDYLFPEDRGCRSWNGLSPGAQSYVRGLENDLGVPIMWIGTGRMDNEDFSMVKRRVLPWE
jgi:adenylosuccinate synthase